VVKELEARRRWPRWLVQVLAALLVSGLAIAGIIAVGNAARDSLGPHDRYLVPFNQIECATPPGIDRSVFLGEVQYNGQFPDSINVLDPTLPDRLRSAFERHRRVQRVVKVSVTPPKRVHVELVLRP
jgi:hypothetical protein